MIDNRELRIGNIVYDEDNQPMYIAGLWPVNDFKQYNFKDSAGNSGNVNILSGIPLSEEVLLKLKFKCVKQSEGNYFSLVINSNGDYLASNPDGFFFVLNNEDNLEDEYLPELSVKLDIKHLHQLQNLYYALTDEELEVSL